MNKPIVTNTVYDGKQKVYRFPNNYGASVVRHQYSRGSDDDLWELAVIRFNSDDNNDFDITYDTPLTDDVIGYLTDFVVELLLDQIAALPSIN